MNVTIGVDGYCRRPLRPVVCPYGRLSVRPEWRYCCNSLNISDIGLKFVWLVHSDMKQIAN